MFEECAKSRFYNELLGSSNVSLGQYNLKMSSKLYTILNVFGSMMTNFCKEGGTLIRMLDKTWSCWNSNPGDCLSTIYFGGYNCGYIQKGWLNCLLGEDLDNTLPLCLSYYTPISVKHIVSLELVYFSTKLTHIYITTLLHIGL